MYLMDIFQWIYSSIFVPAPFHPPLSNLTHPQEYGIPSKWKEFYTMSIKGLPDEYNFGRIILQRFLLQCLFFFPLLDTYIISL